jgi:hypothetical protein
MTSYMKKLTWLVLHCKRASQPFNRLGLFFLLHTPCRSCLDALPPLTSRCPCSVSLLMRAQLAQALSYVRAATCLFLAAPPRPGDHSVSKRWLQAHLRSQGLLPAGMHVSAVHAGPLADNRGFGSCILTVAVELSPDAGGDVAAAADVASLSGEGSSQEQHAGATLHLILKMSHK